MTSGAWSVQEQYEYNAIGNLTHMSGVGTYAYPPSGQHSVWPHAASAAGANSYSYDANPAPLRYGDSLRSRQHGDAHRERRHLYPDVG